MDKKEILFDAVKKLDRQTILDNAYRNDEKPFGFVIDLLKDEYNLPKTEGWNIALAILAFFEIYND